MEILFTCNVVVTVLQENCPAVKNLLLLDSEGKRVAVKYYSDDWPTNQAKLTFEKSLFAKTQKTNARTEGIYVSLLPNQTWSDTYLNGFGGSIIDS